MQWFSDFLYQCLTLFLFVVALAFTMYFLSERDQAKMLWCGFAAWVFVGAAIAVFLNNEVLIEPRFSGTLRPSNDPIPTLRLTIPNNALVVNLGSNFAYSTKPSFLVLRFAGEDALAVNRSEEGISLSARIHSPDGRIVAEIQGNEFTINPNNYFKKKRPDKSTLIVYNQAGEEAINVRFAGAQYMTITGTFHKPGHATISVTPIGIRWGSGNVTSGNICGECTGAAFCC
jgi:hypothetical protein